MLVARRLEYTYIRLSDVLLSIPFHSHQNRSTAAFLSNAFMCREAVPASGAVGLGNTRTSIVDVFLMHSVTHFLPGCRLLPLDHKGSERLRL